MFKRNIYEKGEVEKRTERASYGRKSGLESSVDDHESHFGEKTSK